MNGVLLVDKPAGLTSHDVVDRIRRAAGTRRVGHTGTLDPAATGLLVLCLGHATRLSEHLTGLDKVYEGTMRLGLTTDSYDLDGKVLQQVTPPTFTINTLQDACLPFTGDIEQIPPMVSAVKVGGERLYKKARQGETVVREPRKVTVCEFVVLSYEPPDARIRVRCTRGTYVRSLCHDVGQALGCGAALAALRRTYVGRYALEEAQPLDAFKTPEEVENRLISMDTALDLPTVIIRSSGRNLVVSGSAFGPETMVQPCPIEEGWVQIKIPSGKLLALGMVKSGIDGLTVSPKRVFIG